jgi:hypothetical protein
MICSIISSIAAESFADLSGKSAIDYQRIVEIAKVIDKAVQRV